MTKHTPGPWALDDESIYAPDGEGWKQVAEIPNWRTNPGEVLTPEDNANARLIHAAPDMLGALEVAYTSLIARLGPAHTVTCQVGAAIAKATGG